MGQVKFLLSSGRLRIAFQCSLRANYSYGSKMWECPHGPHKSRVRDYSEGSSVVYVSTLPASPGQVDDTPPNTFMNISSPEQAGPSHSSNHGVVQTWPRRPALSTAANSIWIEVSAPLNELEPGDLTSIETKFCRWQSFISSNRCTFTCSRRYIKCVFVILSPSLLQRSNDRLVIWDSMVYLPRKPNKLVYILI